MSIKASKSSLAALLAESGDDDLVAHHKAKPRVAKELDKPEIEAAEAEVIKPEFLAAVQSEPVIHQVPKATISTHAPVPAQQAPLGVARNGKPYRSQGLTLYESDDDLVDGFIDYLRKKKLRIGRKKGFSLFARAGLRALEDLRTKDPVAFEELLSRALLEQK